MTQLQDKLSTRHAQGCGKQTALVARTVNFGYGRPNRRQRRAFLGWGHASGKICAVDAKRAAWLSIGLATWLVITLALRHAGL